MSTFLLTDDHGGVLDTLAYVFGAQGHRTLLAKCGAAALEIARTETVDAALVDLHMPGMDGLAVCRALREQAISRGADFPVWIMTAAAVPALAAKAIEAGAVAVLRKPFSLDDLFPAVEAYRTGAKPIPVLAPPASAIVDPNFAPHPSGSKPASAR